MLIPSTPLHGMQCTLRDLDDAAAHCGFVRWQWEYTRATYDAKIVDPNTNADYYVRIDARCIQGRLEHPEAVLDIRHIYVGRGTFPHGLDYESPVPADVQKRAVQALHTLHGHLTAHG